MKILAVQNIVVTKNDACGVSNRSMMCYRLELGCTICTKQTFSEPIGKRPTRHRVKSTSDKENDTVVFIHTRAKSKFRLALHIFIDLHCPCPGIETKKRGEINSLTNACLPLLPSAWLPPLACLS